MPLIPLFKYYI